MDAGITNDADPGLYKHPEGRRWKHQSPTYEIAPAERSITAASLCKRCVDTRDRAGTEIVNQGGDVRVLLVGAERGLDTKLTRALDETLRSDGTMARRITVEHVNTIPKTALEKDASRAERLSRLGPDAAARRVRNLAHTRCCSER